jgi:peptidoglycan/LPS O-acetylase OafA/YrhL
VEPLIVIFYFPFLIALGAGARLTASLTRLCNFSGEISYPLYMVHYPFIWIFFSYVEKYKPSMSEMTPVIIVGVILLVVFAYLVMIFIDIPVRNRLKGLLSKNVPVKGQS